MEKKKFVTEIFLFPVQAEVFIFRHVDVFQTGDMKVISVRSFYRGVTTLCPQAFLTNFRWVTKEFQLY